MPRGVCFILAAFHCNGRSGTACQVPLAQAEKIIPRTCCMPDIFFRMSDLTVMGKSKRLESGCTKRVRREEELLHTNPRRGTFAVYSGAERSSPLCSWAQ